MFYQENWTDEANLDQGPFTLSDAFSSPPSEFTFGHFQASALSAWKERDGAGHSTCFNHQACRTFEDRFNYSIAKTKAMGNLIGTYFRLFTLPRPQDESEIEGDWTEVSNSPPQNPIFPYSKASGSSTLQNLSANIIPLKTDTLISPKAQLFFSKEDYSTTVGEVRPSLSHPPWDSLQSFREKCETRKIRGLRNNGNTCFINAILQSLLSCEPFRKLVMETREGGMLIQKFSRLAWDMSGHNTVEAVSKTVNQGIPLTPHSFFGIFPSSACGSQEDAEEFLSFMLNKLHEEELSTRDSKESSEKDSHSCSNGWDTSAVQGQIFLESSISKIFGGSLLSEVRKPFQAPRITEESFFSLSLDIDLWFITSVDHAIRHYFETEMLQSDFPLHGISYEAIQKQAFLYKPPQVLILHLKRFAYNTRTSSLVKVEKSITFPEVLHIPDSIRKWDQNDASRRPKSFELSAVVTDLGSSLASGHYICDIRVKKPDYSIVWVNCNDDIIREVQLEEVLRRKAYILFYTAI